MNRPRNSSYTIALVFALAVSGLAVAVAGPGAAARAKAAPQKSGAALGARLGAAAAKARGPRQPARRAGKSPSKAVPEMSHEQLAALRACVETATSIPATINSSLTADDCDLGDGTRYDFYSFSGAAGQQVSITLTSTDFDAYLFLADFDGQALSVIGEDDDGGGGTNARIPSGSGLATLPYTGTYYVLANAFDPDDTFGAYTLTLATGAGTCPATPAAITFGTTNGSLSSGDCRFIDDTLYDAYSFSGTAGQQVSIELSSASFDAVIYLLDNAREVLGSNDDGGGGTNARLPGASGFITLPYTGTYYVVANQIPPDNINLAPPTGPYTLTLTSGGMCPATPISVGQTIGDGALTAGDCKLPDETPFDLYTFSGTAGQQVSIAMSSAAFDTFLYLASTDGQIFASDDDGGGPNATDSRIPAGSGFFSLPVTGTYHILANAFSPSGSGAYTLALSGPGVPASTFQFSGVSFAAAEGGNAVTVTVTRSGETTGAATVDYATTDGTASERRDYTAALGRLRFAAGETSKTFSVLITDDRFDDDGESFNVTLSAPVGATLGSQSTSAVTIADNDAANGPSPVKPASIDNEFFVRQHYADFLNRVPDAGGLAFWIDQTTNCGNADPLVCRVNVSAAFFISIEFQETGFFAMRVQRVAFGRRSDNASTRVTYRELIRDQRQIGEGVVVGQAGYEGVLEANKQAYTAQVVADPSFASRFPQATADAFVDALYASAGVTPTAAERQEAIDAYNGAGGGAAGRAAALRRAADSTSVRGAEFNPAFVLLQYHGYLRRNPTDAPDTDDTGYQFWLGKLNEFNGNYIQAEMVKAFLESIEYQNRFGL